MIEKNQIQIVGIYCRLSKDDNKGTESNSITSQKESLTDYVKRQGWFLHKVYIDDGFSGVSFDRPAFKDMISDIEKGYLNCIVVKDLSRLGRNYLDSGYYIEKYFPEHNIRFVAVNDSLDTLEGENDFGPFKNIINEWYAKDISKKIKFSFNTKAKQGNLIQGFAPYGYVKAKDSLDFEIDEEAAKIISYIFKSISNKIPAKEVIDTLKKNKVYIPGYYNYIKKNVNKEKYETISETKKYAWDYWKLDSILTNEIYVGTLINFKKRKVTFRSKKLVPNDPSKILKIENRFPAIISKEMFDAVQEIRSFKFRASRGEHKEFSNLIYCGDCGRKIILRQQSRSKQHYFYCAKETKGCGGHYIPLTVLQDLISNDFKDLQSFISIVPKEILITKLNQINQQKNNNQIAIYQKKNTKHEQRLKYLTNLMKKLLDTYALGILPDDAYQSLMKDYKKEYDEISSQSKILKTKIENIKPYTYEIVSKQQLSFLLNIDANQLFEQQLLKNIVKSIRIYEKNEEGNKEKTILIEYYGLGVLK
ncbi:MAG: recombinase family protein [Roseburia sp.]|nr:recombinase family protein [Anaeroplasma bactoclasticum]MCM1196357.1 recombinase family protein [Roseburia sp.]